MPMTMMIAMMMMMMMMQVSNEFITESTSVAPRLVNENNLMIFVDVIRSAVKMLRTSKCFTMFINICLFSFHSFISRVSTTPGNPGNLIEFTGPPGNYCVR